MNRFFIQPDPFRTIALLTALCLLSLAPVTAQETNDPEEFSQGDAERRPAAPDTDPVELFNRAQDAHAKGELETALELYGQALGAWPEFPEAEYQRGTIYLSLGRIAEAETAFRRAIELRRDWTLPIAELGALLVRKGEHIEAEEKLNQAIRLNEMSFPAYVALAELKIGTKASPAELRSLLAKLQYLTNKSRIPAAVWAARGALERALGDQKAARTSVERALGIDPKSFAARAEAVELSLLSGDPQGAVRIATELDREMPNSDTAKLLLARALHADGRRTEAIAALERIRFPSPEVLNFKRSVMLEGNDDTASLLALLEKDPDNASVHGRLCVLFRTSDPVRALEHCSRAAGLEPDRIDHAIGFGAALVQLKRYDTAASLFEKLLENSPENYTIRANLATALFQLGRFDEAIRQYRWITSREPDLAVAYYFMAISHDRLEEYLDAMANYQQFLRLADDSLKLEVEKVRLRLPTLQTQIKQGKGKNRRQ